MHYKRIFMQKKISSALVLLSIAHSTTHGMFLLRRAHVSSMIVPRVPVVLLNTKVPNINDDFAVLHNYTQELFGGVVKNISSDIKPSGLLQYIRDKSDINTKTRLKYMSATSYMHSFITNKKYAEWDGMFIDKCNELQDRQATWNWFHGHFMEHMKTSMGLYAEDLLERDAARLREVLE